MTQPDILTGQFGPYRIERLLGQGGMACVYLASHPQHGQVALKVLHQHLVKRPEVLHRFWREMRLSEKLDHGRIVRVKDSGVEGDRFYLAMDFIDGPSLFEFEREHGPLPCDVAIQMMKTILDALYHAHEAGMIHRDLKPENILISGIGEPYISDFGIAKHLEGTKLTQTGTAVGTPYYMAPEQIRNAKEVGPAADIYSAGILLYEMLTGSVPYNADDPMAVAHHHIHGTPVAPSSLRKGIPPELELVVLKAMEKKPEDRFKSARFMQKALEMVEQGKATGIKIVGPVEYRDKGPSGFMLLVVLLVLSLVGVWLVKPELLDQLRREGSRLLDQVAQVDIGAPPPGTGTGDGGPPPVAAPTQPDQPPPSPKDLPDLIRTGDWARARMAAHLGGKRSELHVELWMQRLRELIDRKKVFEARVAVEEFRNAFPTVIWGPFLLGEVCLAEGKQDEAATAFSEGFRLAPTEQVEGFFDRYRPSLRELEVSARQILKAELRRVSDLRLRAGAIDESIMLLRQSSKIFETADTHNEIGRLYEQQGRGSKARWHRKRAELLEAGTN